MKNKKEMDFNGRSVTCHSPAFIKLKLFHLQLIVFTLLLVKSRIPALISVSVSASLSLSLSLKTHTRNQPSLARYPSICTLELFCSFMVITCLSIYPCFQFVLLCSVLIHLKFSNESYDLDVGELWPIAWLIVNQMLPMA